MLPFFKKQELYKTKSNPKTASTIKHAKHYLSRYLKKIEHIVAAKPQEVIEAWNEMLGTKYSGMFQALGFKDHILLVKIYNSSLYALLKQTHQSSLIARLHQAVPHAQVKEIQFLLG
ncbi:DciA family protein [Chlamydia vaughanii]|uniref:DciA family protein n=1 Tax=Chlamydia vaughanii TaxID=3112552 RepID=UPI0032B23B8F